MKRKNARPKKRLGQNFLYDPAIAEKIVSAASPAPGDVFVELGAGRGILTRALLARGVRLIALELDAALCEQLGAELNAAGDHDSGTGDTHRGAGSGFELINADFTGVSLRNLLKERGLERCSLIGNIPYYLTREVLFGYLVEERAAIDGATIMVQKEVGDRIVSPPGSRVYGITSVVLQSLYDVKAALKVSPGSFQPRPKVASVVLRFAALDAPPLEEGEVPGFVALVKNVFQQRRKTLHNTLKSFYSLDGGQLDALGEATGLDLGSRPEALSKEEFHRLARSLAEVSKS